MLRHPRDVSQVVAPLFEHSVVLSPSLVSYCDFSLPPSSLFCTASLQHAVNPNLNRHMLVYCSRLVLVCGSPHIVVGYSQSEGGILIYRAKQAITWALCSDAKVM